MTEILIFVGCTLAGLAMLTYLTDTLWRHSDHKKMREVGRQEKELSHYLRLLDEEQEKDYLMGKCKTIHDLQIMNRKLKKAVHENLSGDTVYVESSEVL